MKTKLEGWRILDNSNGLIFPWYTEGFLDELVKWDIKNWKVFEYGAGDSTIWWKSKAKLVYSVDSNREWANKTNSFFSDDKTIFMEYPLTLIEEDKFDCIIIDGDPVLWRDECTEIALKSIKVGGILIIDNYNQKTVNLEFLPKTDELLKDKEKHVYQQEGHEDWKTAYWVI